MSFFKKYNGTTNLRLARIETAIWVLIYGGLLAVVVGLFMARRQDGGSTLLIVGGAVLVVIGAGLVYVRSRLREER